MILKPPGEQQPVAVLPRLAERRVRQEPLLEVVDEVRIGVALQRGRGVELDRLRDRCVVNGLGDQPLVEHGLEGLVAPDATVHGMDERIEVVGRPDQAGQQGASRDREILGVDPEVRPRGGLDAIRTLAEVHGVQVLGQDLVLRQAILQLPRQDGLVDLPPEGLVVPNVELLHQLLGDRGPSLDDLSGRDVGVRGTNDRSQVEPVVIEEPLVLHRDGRIADRLRHLGAGEHHAIFAGVELGDQAAVGREEERRLGERDRSFAIVGQPRQRATGGADDREHDDDEGESPAPPHRASVPLALGRAGSIRFPWLRTASPC